MNQKTAMEILQAYRPGEELESYPEVRQALDLARNHPELAAVQREIESFDEAFRSRMRSVEVPAGLQAQILDALQARKPPVASARETGRLLQWIHPAAFAAAAAIVLLLALTFTFWSRPDPGEVQPLVIDNPLMATADTLYANLKPSFVSREGGGAQIVDYLQSRGGIVPSNLPNDFSWDRTLACDVMEVNGKKVSLVCFKTSDQTGMLHLFAFNRADFPELSPSPTPRMGQSKEGPFATWANEDSIYVLYADEGEENLRQFLEI